jgi:hypothetical protein
VQPSLFGPIGIWQVGRSYFDDPHRLVFVGKNARGSLRDDVESELSQRGFIDGTTAADQMIGEKWGAYWNYTAEIITRVFGSLSLGWERIAFTNLMKCNNSMSMDTTNGAMKENCLKKLGVAWKELDILEPRNIVMFTGDRYDSFIDQWSSRFEWHDKSRRDNKVPNGNKTILWWERDCFDGKGRRFRLLRTSHPERQKKEPFVERIARWVTCTE